MSFISGAGLVSDSMRFSEHFSDLKNPAVNRKKETFAHDPQHENDEVLYDVWLLEDLYYDATGLVPDSGEPAVLRDKHGILCWAVTQAAKSASGLTMLEEAIHDGWALALEDLGGPDFHLDVPQRRIVLDSAGLLISALGGSAYFRHVMLVSFIRALRDVWQERRHGGFDETYAPEDVLLLERVRAADLDVLAILVAWELRSENPGERQAENPGGLWRHMIGSEDGDMAMRFSGCLERDPGAILNGRALNAAFTQWFCNPNRVSACEHEILNDLDALVIECREENEVAIFGRETLKPVKIESLSCLPDRTAYLRGQGRDIISNPLYAGMDDIVNQTHLMQLLYDMQVTWVQDVPFRDPALAAKIFPGGEFTDMEED